MIQIDVRSNVREVVAELNADVEKIGTAQLQALNRTADGVRTDAGREIRNVYNIKLAAVRKASTIERATKSQIFPRATVSFTGKRIPLIEFAPSERRVISARGPRRGVSVKVLVAGARKLVSGGFVVTLKRGPLTGTQGIFKRVGAARTPIRFLRSISIPSALAAKAVTAAILKAADERFTENFTAALRNQLRG